ncbi:MAG TPA: hypothetical protein VFI14_01870, partial [Chryseosolibacter sp.]|nr:hypothetical protein [Chryseosolibacter sp.]
MFRKAKLAVAPKGSKGERVGMTGFEPRLELLVTSILGGAGQRPLRPERSALPRLIAPYVAIR